MHSLFCWMVRAGFLALVAGGCAYVFWPQYRSGVGTWVALAFAWWCVGQFFRVLTAEVPYGRA